MKRSKTFLSSPYLFIFALMLGVILAVGGSVLATSIGNNVSVSGTLTSSGAFTVSASSASSSVSYALGVGTTTPAMTLAVGGAAGNTSGHVYLTGGLGVGIATTSSGGIELSGNVLFGDASTDLVMFNAATVIYNNNGTTTLPSSAAAARAIATTSANIPFMRFDTSAYRIGISTTTPGATFSVGGAGDIYALGTLTIDGNVVLGNAAADTITINASSTTYNNVATTTIAASQADSFAFATSSASVPFLKFNTATTNGYRFGIGTTTPGATLAVGGAGNIYGAGNLSIDGTTLLGDAGGDTITINASSTVYNNAATTTIPASNSNSFSFATSSANIPFVKFDTNVTSSNGYRVGIGTTTPGGTLAVEGDGTIIVVGSATSTLSISSTAAAASKKGGCIELESAVGDGTRFSLMATGAGIVYWTAGGCR